MRIKTHPGEILHLEFMQPLGLSANRLSGMIGVPANRISELVRCRRGVTADTAKRLAAVFNTTPQFWTNLQASYDLSVAESTHAAEYEHIKPVAETVHA